MRVVGVFGILGAAMARYTSEDLYWMHKDEYAVSEHGQYDDYFFNPNHQMMDYRGYKQAKLQDPNVLPRQGNLPGADFNMRVTESRPYQ